MSCNLLQGCRSGHCETGRGPYREYQDGQLCGFRAPPIATAQELATLVRAKIPGAQIDFKPDLELQKILDKSLLSLDDSIARKEWGWEPEYDQARIVEDFVEEMRRHPERYTS